MRHFPPLLALAGLAVLLGGCHLDLTRVQEGNPLPLEAYERLAAGKSTLGEALAGLGAPERVEWKSGKDYLWYEHLDYVRIGLRFELPNPALNVRHNVVELDGASENTNRLELVFDERGVLERKSLKLPEAYAAARDPTAPGWSFYLLPKAGVLPLFAGDGGEKRFDGLFEVGTLGGLELGFLPAPCFLLLVGGEVQRYHGERFRRGAARVEIGDLDIYHAQVGGRLQVPPGFFGSFWKLEELKRLLYATDIRAFEHGPFLYFKFLVGAFYSEELRARVNGADAGPYFEQSHGFSSSFGGGVEYRWGRAAAHLEALYQSLDRFKRNRESPLDTDADALSAVIISAGLSVRF